MDKWCNHFFTYQCCKCCLMEAILKDKELQTKYSERKCSDDCCPCCGKHKYKVTGCDLDSKWTCCLLWCPCCHTCGTMSAEKKAGYLVDHSDYRCCPDTFCPGLCIGACIYASSTKGPKIPDEMDADTFTPIAPPGAFVL